MEMDIVILPHAISLCYPNELIWNPQPHAEDTCIQQLPASSGQSAKGTTQVVALVDGASFLLCL